MQQRVGTCSLCGGAVMGYRGVWMSISPPPPDTCSGCGAVRGDDVIEMARPGTWPVTTTKTKTSASD